MSAPTPHKRRTPCCEIEAWRYLTNEGIDVDSERAEAVRTALDALRERVEERRDMFRRDHDEVGDILADGLDIALVAIDEARPK